MSCGKAMHQKSIQMELWLEDRGEAPRLQPSGEAGRAVCGDERSGSDSLLMERVVARENAKEAFRRVRRNKGSPGIDGMTVGELERRGHSFVCYADDCNVYVRSRRAGQRVLAALRRKYAKLRLRINEEKSAVALAWYRKFLGYSFWLAKGRVVKLRVAAKALEEMKYRVRRNPHSSAGDLLRAARSASAGRINLNSLNRRMRTRMSGGVGGV